MPFLMQMDCPCCKDWLHHCERCWNRFHNGQKHKDYQPPSYYGESIMSDEVREKMNKELKIKMIPNIKTDKNRKYKEGEYH